MGSKLLTGAARAVGADRPLAAVTASWMLVNQARGYPLEYLFRPDPEIWTVQLGAWILILLEAAIAAVAVCFAAGALRRMLAPAVEEFPFGGAARRLGNLLRSRHAPILAGVLSALAAAAVWGLARPVLVVHDEAAYLLQARLFASGRWTAPAAPFPQFFEQLYVFFSPFTAAKYPPGFPVALVPGVWLGAPVIVPILLVGVSGGLLFSLARDVANESVAAVAWLLWTTTPYETWQVPPFMSQHLSTALCLASWWALLRWKRGERGRYLLLLGFFVGWGAITRPLTMFVAAIPIAFVVSRRILRSGDWKSILAPNAVVLCFLLVIPLWARKTTGDWKVTPLALYVRTYTPYDGLGFGPGFGLPEKKLPADLAAITRHLVGTRRRYRVENLPFHASDRLAEIRKNALPGWRAILAPLALYALFSVPAEAFVAVATGFLNFIAYLFLAHPVALPVYYFETYPLLAFLAAWGLWKLATGPQRSSAGSISLGFLLLVLAIAPAAGDLYRRRVQLQLIRDRKSHFEETLRAIPGRAVVFVRYTRPSDAFSTLVENDPDLERERIWIARDLGTENDRLRRIAPDRKAYLYLTGPEIFEPLAPLESNTSSRTPSEVPR